MGVAEHIDWANAACWNGTAFDGAWNTRLAGSQDVLEPATGQPIWRTGVANAADMAAAIGKAHAAQAAWAATPPRERAAKILQRKWLNLRRARKTALAGHDVAALFDVVRRQRHGHVR